MSSRFHLVDSPSGSRLPPPPSYQVATMMSPMTHFGVPHHHHRQHQQTPVTSAPVPLTSSLPASLLAPAITAHDRKMSFQIDSSAWKDREPTHFRWSLMPAVKTENQEFHHALPTSYDEVTLTAVVALVERWTRDRKVAGFTPGRGAINLSSQLGQLSLPSLRGR